MKLPYRFLPATGESCERPLVDVRVDGVEWDSLVCLVDSGSLGNRFGQWVAEVSSIDLTEAPVSSISVGGLRLVGRTTLVDLCLDDHRWTTEVTFCDPWPWDFQLLGQEGFFRYFRVCFDAAELTMEVEPAAK